MWKFLFCVAGRANIWEEIFDLAAGTYGFCLYSVCLWNELPVEYFMNQYVTVKIFGFKHLTSSPNKHE